MSCLNNLTFRRLTTLSPSILTSFLDLVNVLYIEINLLQTALMTAVSPGLLLISTSLSQ